MNVTDAEMVSRLAERDGPMRTTSLSHRSAGPCRYREFYPDVECPWCAAEDARIARESAPITEG